MIALSFAHAHTSWRWPRSNFGETEKTPRSLFSSLCPLSRSFCLEVSIEAGLGVGRVGKQS